jgi:hypothetical protein
MTYEQFAQNAQEQTAKIAHLIGRTVTEYGHTWQLTRANDLGVLYFVTRENGYSRKEYSLGYTVDDAPRLFM